MQFDVHFYNQFKEDLDQIVPTMNNWEKSEQKEELAQTLA